MTIIQSIDTDCQAKGIALKIDGREIEAAEGATVLEAAERAGIYIPALCSYPDLTPLAELKPDRACRLCVIEVEGCSEPQLACSTRVAAQMVVQTRTPQLQSMRRNSLKLILSRHPNACLDCHRRERCSPFDVCLRHVAVTERCISCPQNGNCELQRVVDFVGAVDNPGVDTLPVSIPKKLPVREDSPFFVRDNNLCILCERCVRVCEDIRGVRAIEFAYRGTDAS